MSLVAALAAIAPIVIGPLVTAAEKLFGGGGTGETKKQVVMASATEILKAMATAGKLPALPDQRDIEVMLEAQVAAMKAVGGDAGAPTIPGTWTLQIPPGCEVVIRSK